jgi:hypothetical protein
MNKKVIEQAPNCPSLTPTGMIAAIWIIRIAKISAKPVERQRIVPHTLAP